MLWFLGSILIGIVLLHSAREEADQSARAVTEAEAARRLEQAQRLRLGGRIFCFVIPVLAVVYAVATFEPQWGF